MKKTAKKKHPVVRYTIWGIIVIIIAAAMLFMRYGGFHTGKSANVKEFALYAEKTEDIRIPDEARVIALGEATHGNEEFQQLKLDVFKVMVEKYHVHAFALEGDYGGCEQVNRYIHGGEGTPEEAAEAIGFTIYRTDEMAELISYMRQYNETANPGEDVRFYGFDMQRWSYNMQFLTEACEEWGISVSGLQEIADGEGDASSQSEKKKIIEEVRKKLIEKGAAAPAVHLADILLQNMKLGELSGNASYAMERDAMMKENVMWIAEQEKERGYERIFISGHNGHIAKWGNYENMGKMLRDELGSGYYAIGTDFYKTRCSMPTSSPEGTRTDQTFYSHDPLAKAAKKAGFKICWLDFGKVPQNTELAEQIRQKEYMGSLGEGYSWYMRLLPLTYRICQAPTELYDGMIFVSEAHPINIFEKNN